MTSSAKPRRELTALLAGYSYLGVMALLTWLALPWFARTLGPEVWGEVAQVLILQGLLLAIDIALAPIALRELARAAVAGSLAEVYAGYRRLYWRIALSALVLVELLAWMMQAWQPALLTGDSWLLLQLALLQFLAQFVNLSATACWHAQGRQIEANLRLTVFALGKYLGAASVLAAGHDSALAYLLPFAMISVLECLANAWRLRGQLGKAPVAILPKSIGPDILRSGLVGVLALLCTQIDRLLLVLYLPDADLGRYFLLSVLMLSVLHLQMPIQRVFLPRMAVAEHASSTRRRMSAYTLGLLALPCWLAIPLAEPLLTYWLGEPQITAPMVHALQLMLFGLGGLLLAGPFIAEAILAQRWAVLIRGHALILFAQITLLLTLAPALGLLAGALCWPLAALGAWLLVLRLRIDAAKQNAGA